MKIRAIFAIFAVAAMSLGGPSLLAQSNQLPSETLAHIANAATPASVTLGEPVDDINGNEAGRITALHGNLLILSTSHGDIQIPINALERGAAGLNLSIRADQLSNLISVVASRAKHGTSGKGVQDSGDGSPP